MQARTKLIQWIRQGPRWRLALPIVILLAAIWWLRPGRTGPGESVTFTARRGPLDISVIEGGSIQALESQEIKCEVRVGYQGVKILKIVDEGYQVTEDDVRTNKLIVELDSSDIQKQIIEQEIRYQSSAASLTEAQQGFDIQVNQNLSDIKGAEQKARFARMDFDRFLGEDATETLLGSMGLSNILDLLTNVSLSASSTLIEPPPGKAPDAVPPGGTAPVTEGAQAKVQVLSTTVQASPAPEGKAGSKVVVMQAGNGLPTQLPELMPPADAAAKPPEAMELPAPSPSLPMALLEPKLVDFSTYADLRTLGDGEAKQKIRKFQDDLMVARRELEQSRANQEGTKRLLDKGFETRINMERDDLALTNSLLKVKTAETAQDLFLKYEFIKLSEESLSKYLEAVRELDRARKAAISKMAQADARLKSAHAQFNVQLRQRRDLYDQLAKCMIRAEKPGLVVYGGGEEAMWRGEEQVREGATVRERQSIITIPDMTKMSVKTRIPESYIKQVKKGQKARVTLDAFPDQTLEGEVTYVGVLPDSQNRWMNPDMKVYRTTVSINGTHDWLKPGMSAKVEIQVDRLGDVVYVPIQAIVPTEGKQLCYVANGGAPEPREVSVGQFNDSFIEIKSGLQEGDVVLLRPPGAGDRQGAEPAAEPTQPGKPAPAAPAATPPTTVAGSTAGGKPS